MEFFMNKHWWNSYEVHILHANCNLPLPLMHVKSMKWSEPNHKNIRPLHFMSSWNNKYNSKWHLTDRHVNPLHRWHRRTVPVRILASMRASNYKIWKNYKELHRSSTLLCTTTKEQFIPFDVRGLKLFFPFSFLLCGVCRKQKILTDIEEWSC